MADPSFLLGSGIEMNYFYDDKKFIRKVIVHKEQLEKNNKIFLEQYKMILEASK
ncbi:MULTISPECIES: hypothetical protein [Flavobacterium]|uniref:Uncharacterized protein n=2 Tax=Flavobacterium TaxID=237 RepID=A0ABW8PL13_9FLAO|nr:MULTISPECIES: hypothetical protein [Flavobacterium]QYS88429.1 hypothetical protein JJC05_12165 [Flavobacterium davisii]